MNVPTEIAKKSVLGKIDIIQKVCFKLRAIAKAVVFF